MIQMVKDNNKNNNNNNSCNSLVFGRWPQTKRQLLCPLCQRASVSYRFWNCQNASFLCFFFTLTDHSAEKMLWDLFICSRRWKVAWRKAGIALGFEFSTNMQAWNKSTRLILSNAPQTIILEPSRLLVFCWKGSLGWRVLRNTIKISLCY